MTRETILRAIAREHPVKTSPKSVTPTSVEVVPLRGEIQHILSTLGEMEQMIEETFHKPFFGAFPFRRLFHEGAGLGEYAPSCDVFERGNEVVVKAEIPGMKREDISVKLVDNNLIISGEKKAEEKIERKDYLRFERSHGYFNRSLALPEGVDTTKIKASYKDGLLEVRLPKAAGKGGAKQITVE